MATDWFPPALNGVGFGNAERGSAAERAMRCTFASIAIRKGTSHIFWNCLANGIAGDEFIPCRNTSPRFRGTSSVIPGRVIVTVRAFLLPAMFVALFAASYSPVRSELPQAPAPRVKRTTQELLVGTWKMVKSSQMKVGPSIDRRIEFTADGKFFLRWHDPGLEFQKKDASYQVTGQVIRLTYEGDADGPRAVFDTTIEAITEDELRIAGGPLNDRQWHVYRRVKAK